MRCHKKVVALVVLLLILLAWFSVRPSNDRDWNADQELLSYASFEEDMINIFNIRNFSYRNTTDFDIKYYNKSLNLSKLNEVWFIVEPFGDWEGAAHTFVSFGFDSKDYVAMSIEIRKEVGEEFSAFKGIFKKYELMYVIGDENDLVKLRSNYRRDDVFLYPINTTKPKIKEMFLEMIKKTNELNESPEFYNTLTTTCTTNLVKHINSITDRRVPFSFKILAPGYSDELAYNLGLINTNLPFSELRDYYRINENAIKYENSSDFSGMIRTFKELNSNGI